MRKPPEELLAGHLPGAVRDLARNELRRVGAQMGSGANTERDSVEGEERPAGAAPAGRARDAAGDSAPLLPRRPQVPEELQSRQNSLPLL